jgi:hypothetical protein
VASERLSLYNVVQRRGRRTSRPKDARHYTLPELAWVDSYYDILAPRASALLVHMHPSVRAFAAETIKEIEVFQHSGGSYGYVFDVLQRPRLALCSASCSSQDQAIISFSYRLTLFDFPAKPRIGFCTNWR